MSVWRVNIPQRSNKYNISDHRKSENQTSNQTLPQMIICNNTVTCKLSPRVEETQKPAHNITNVSSETYIPLTFSRSTAEYVSEKYATSISGQTSADHDSHNATQKWN